MASISSYNIISQSEYFAHFKGKCISFHKEMGQYCYTGQVPVDGKANNTVTVSLTYRPLDPIPDSLKVDFEIKTMINESEIFYEVSIKSPDLREKIAEYKLCATMELSSQHILVNKTANSIIFKNSKNLQTPQEPLQEEESSTQQEGQIPIEESLIFFFEFH